MSQHGSCKLVDIDRPTTIFQRLKVFSHGIYVHTAGVERVQHKVAEHADF